MTEKLLQYLWNYKIFKTFDFKDTEGVAIEVLDFGKWNHDSGPDFLLGKVKINGVTLVGHIELHQKSSDWIFHQHSHDSAYENVILHVVFLHDVEIEDLKARNTPTLELKSYIAEETLQKYQMLSAQNEFIPCEKLLSQESIPFGFSEETLLKKLDEKSLLFEEGLKLNKNDWEAVLFHHLAYAFGLKINADIFKQIAESVDFGIVQKVSQNRTQLEALLYGKAGWLGDLQDEQVLIWKREFDFLRSKFNLSEITFSPKFLRLRPPNFPTIRLSQLAHLYHREKNLFSKLISAQSLNEIKTVFEGISASEYWDNHFNFGKISEQNYSKLVSTDFIDRLLINAVLPIKYAYHKNQEEEILDVILDFYKEMDAEENSVISQWISFDVKIESALESQAFLYQYKNFCLVKNCLNCSIGFGLLKGTKI